MSERYVSKHPLYKTWARMIDRCGNPDAHNYRWYGAKGVRVCERWRLSFDAFVDDVGARPVGATLDRFPDKHGDYAPGNVRWATKIEQGNNARNNILVDVGGVTRTLKEWSREYGVRYAALYQLVARGRSLLDAVEALRVSSKEGGQVRRVTRRPEISKMLLSGASTAEILRSIKTSPPVISACRKALGLGRGRANPS